MNEKGFANFKKQVLKCPDASKKGDFDEKMKSAINYINSMDRYVTLSSCSGRTVVVIQNFDGTVQKEGCRWAYCSHDFVDAVELIERVSSFSTEGSLTFKIEPFILHVGCASLEDARIMLSCALKSGCKNSGMVVGKHGRFTVAARNTSQIEVPLTSEGKMLVSDEYLSFLAKLANEKMKTNFDKLLKFECCLKELRPTTG